MNKDYMLRMKPKVIGVSSPGGGWEMRPGGMLVQKRNSDANLNSNTVPTIRVNVKYGSSYHEVIISSQASFGELKKILAGRTGLNTQDQKLVFKEKERDSKDFLDFCGVKNGSKIVLMEDEVSMQRRWAEAKMEKALEDIAAIRFEVDNLAKHVASAEVEINGGKKVVETVLLNLIEQLMTQLIKLDGIAADGDVKMQRRMQVKRVQKYIEILDVLKLRNSGLGKTPLQQFRTPKSFQKQKEQRQQGSFVDPGKVVVTTKWETF
ncbi:BAG family molecular chaperone regulator 3-like [Andrographis paniculata]|uniref:BAG family molecular chaperone regulator 3-like n=1 Tax=Andrographis paniculata TaxID=175694 RepID=UPI0021E983B5|nr:BAG family molecular chaperone regulator 3-like [Andrographis paniculata]XP_051137454.1 BAG family molecular chaperone regulator 3-like [Andrographis paniculata]XP_051137455.1 BAG family molecular chaperone regulator 3-like [Andrographis paniculata]XP_051137456.1 BAG family molecular chaperone regulator 3-like [Andrographis paniculata]